MAILTRPGTGSSRRTVSGPTRPTSYAVNLLPPEAALRQRARVLVRRFVIGAVGLAVVGAGVWLGQASTIASANDELASAESDLAGARSQLEPLQPVKAFSVSLDRQEELVGTSMARHTSFSRTLRGFADAWPAGSNLRTLEASVGTACAGPDTFQPAPSSGCLSWTVSVGGEVQVRRLTASLAKTPGLVSPFLTGAVRDAEGGDFEATGTVNFDDRMLTGRFHDLLEGVAP
jgi:hypothetical protein